MSDERRDDERSPDFRKVELVTINSGGNERAYPVTLRDTSDKGLGGMYVGMVDEDMTLAETLRVFTTLTIGDGLVSQIPAFIISIAAAIISLLANIQCIPKLPSAKPSQGAM